MTLSGHLPHRPRNAASDIEAKVFNPCLYFHAKRVTILKAQSDGFPQL